MRPHFSVRFSSQSTAGARVEDLDVNAPGGGAAWAGGLLAFRPRFQPLDRRSELAGQERQDELLRIEMHLGAETAADIGRDDAQQLLRNTDRLGDPATMHVRDLASHVDRQPAVDARFGKNRARLHAGGYESVVDDAQLQDLVGFPRCRGIVATGAFVARRHVAWHVHLQLTRPLPYPFLSPAYPRKPLP